MAREAAERERERKREEGGERGGKREKIIEYSLNSYFDIRSLGNGVSLTVCDTTDFCEAHGGLHPC